MNSQLMINHLIQMMEALKKKKKEMKSMGDLLDV
jgi:hypothetical protein